MTRNAAGGGADREQTAPLPLTPPNFELDLRWHESVEPDTASRGRMDRVQSRRTSQLR
jgi:hypothetical protein